MTDALRFAVCEIVDNLIFALFGFAVAVVGQKLFCDLRAFHGHEIAPGINFVVGVVVPYENGKTDGTHVVARADERAFVHVDFKRFPLDKAHAFDERRRLHKERFLQSRRFKS